MSERTLITPFLGTIITLLFVFSTIFTLAYYYYQGTTTSLQVAPLGGTANNPTSLSFIGAFDAVLGFLAWISPFALVRGLVLAVAPTDLFQVLDLLIMRPVSWIVSIFTVNYIISKIPTVSGEI